MVVGGSPGRLAGILVTFVTRSWGHVGVVSEVGGNTGKGRGAVLGVVGKNWETQSRNLQLGI